MPLYTKNYDLAAFKWGEVYSAFEDRRRFTIIDNQMDLISGKVGNGVLYGWDIIEDNDGVVSVSDGMGIINNFVVNSFGGYSLTLDEDSNHYLYMKKRNVVGGVSGGSNIAYSTAVNETPPNIPSGVERFIDIVDYLANAGPYDEDFILYLKKMAGINTLEGYEILDYSQIAFEWEHNDDFDFSHYVIKRSLDSSSFEKIFETERNVFIDINLDQNTEYYYQLFAVDKSGNISDPLEFSFSTEKDKRIPLSPLNLQLFPGRNSLQAMWDGSPSDNVYKYRVVLEYEGEIVKSEDISLSDDDFYNYIFRDINDSITYSVYVYSLSQYMFDENKYDLASYSKLDEYVMPAEDLGEIGDFHIHFSKSSIDDVNIEADLKWNFEEVGSNMEVPSKFRLTIIDDFGRYSRPIEIFETESRNTFKNTENPYDYLYNLRYIPYYDEDLNRIFYETIREFSSYIFILQTIDDNDIVSYGKIIKINRTPVSKDLSSVSEFSIRRNNNNSLFMRWRNPSEEHFSYNLITIYIDGIEEPIINNKNISRSSSFILSPDYFDANNRYHIHLYSYDFFNNLGSEFEFIKLFDIDEDDRVLPNEINNLSITPGDRSLTLYWVYDLEINNEVVSFNVYKANYSFYLSLSDFSLIATLPSSQNKIVDYNVQNGETYVYLISSVDIYGNESFDFEPDAPIPYNSVSGTPSKMFVLDSPSELSVSLSDNDFYLQWEQEFGSFDGYQILRSFDNNYSFEVVGYCSPFESEYIDKNAALVDGKNYYYIIRKFLNEVDLSVYNEPIYSSDYLFIGKIVTFNGTDNISIDLSGVRNILNFEDPIKEIVEEKINIHNHRLERGLDKRIELRSNVSVHSWETNDYISYTTEEDLSYVDNFSLRINGQINEDYFKDSRGNIDFSSLQMAVLGSSPVSFSVDKKQNKIIFSSPIYSDCVPNPDLNIECPNVPYLTEPLIRLDLHNISEVDNFLSSEKIKDVSASQFTTGVLDIKQTPDIDHEGRIGEKLIPVKLNMWTIDNFLYFLSNEYEGDRNKLGSAVSFYDIVHINNEFILAATSNGIWGSNDFGNSWESLFNFDSSPHKLYKSSFNKVYALTNNKVYVNRDSIFRAWDEMSGLDGVRIIRDIVEDDKENLYISTDLGVFKFNKEVVPYFEEKWRRLDIYGPRSSESYSLFFYNGRILVSNEMILLESDDYGSSWKVYDSFVFGKIWDIIRKDNYIFCLSDNALYRKRDDEDDFMRVKYFENSICRKIEIFNDRIFALTDNGVLSSSINIYESAHISFVKSFSELDINNIIVPAICLKNVEDSYLLVGTDRRLLIMDNKFRVWEQYSQKNTVVPTFYINSKEIKLGLYYNNISSTNNVYFDDKTLPEDIIEVSNKYDIYHTENGGWVLNKYDSKFIVYKNYNKLAESRDEIDIDISYFVNIEFPVYNDLNAHKIQADEYKDILEEKINYIISDFSLLNKDEKRKIVVDTYMYFDKFLSQIYDGHRVIFRQDGSLVNFVLPPIKTDLVNKINILDDFGEWVEKEIPLYSNLGDRDYSTEVNIVNGKFVFDIPFDKYDVLSIDIKGVSVDNIGGLSHRNLEDRFEDIYSGFTSYLSQVQQVNLLKLGLFNEKMFGEHKNNHNSLINTKTIIPKDYSYFDGFNSTFNFFLYESNINEEFSIDYSSVVKYIPFINKIFVGGWEGVLSIDKDSLSMFKINIDDVKGQMIRDIFVFEDIIYIISSKNIFYSNDGEKWETYRTNGLPNNLYSIGSIRDNMVVGAEDGIYIKRPSLDIEWRKTIDSDLPVSIMYSSNVLFSVINKNIHISNDGYSFRNTELGENINITNLNRLGNLYVYVSSLDGLYFDSNSFNSSTNRLVEIDLGDLFQYGHHTINDVYADNDIVSVGISNGSYGVIRGDTLRIREYSSLPTIHKVLIVDEEIWLFGNGMLKVPYIDYPIKLVEGIPL